MNQILEKLALDLINFNKIDERKNKNKKRDHFMYSCFKIFIIILIITIIYLLICKCLR